MPRPRAFSDERFMQVYNDSKHNREIGEALGVSLVSVYKHLKRLGLDSKVDEPGHHLRRFTDEEFDSAYHMSTSVEEMAAKLGVAKTTVWLHLRTRELKKFGRVLAIDSVKGQEMFKRYKSSVTIKDLAQAYDYTSEQIRLALLRAIEDMAWPSRDFDKPNNLDEVRIYNALCDHPKLPAETIADHTKTTVDQVEAYVSRKVKPACPPSSITRPKGPSSGRVSSPTTLRGNSTGGVALSSRKVVRRS